MKKLTFPVLALLTLTLLSSCEAIASIFKAGMWTGIIGVIFVVALIIWIISKIFGGGNRP